MGKFEESFDRRNVEALNLGIENEKIIQQATSWCRHFRADMQSAGLLAQMSGLPIGSIGISCQYAEQYLEGMDLVRIVPTFIIENCAKCLHNEPNGDVSWAKEIIENHKQQVQEYEKAELVRQEQLRAIRERLRELPRQAKEDANLDERQILTYIEKLFSEDEGQQDETAKLLIQAARIGADLFSDTAINILLEQSLSDNFASKCLPICAELVKIREDLSTHFMRIALTAIEKNIHPELAANILIQLGKTVNYPLSTSIIQNLIDHQNHNFLYYLSGRKPSYPNSTRVLILSYESNPSSIIESFRSRLKCDNKDIRINVYGALKLLQSENPQIGLDLLPELVDSLELYDDSFGGSADKEAEECIAKALCYAPSFVDEYLVSVIRQKRPAEQEEIINVYDRVFRANAENQHNTTQKLTNIKAEVQISINRCLEFVKDEFLDMDVRYQALESLESASFWCTQVLVSKFDTLLGYYALICPHDEPPPTPRKIILPGHKIENQRLAFLDKVDYRQKWYSLKRKLLQILEKLVEHEPKSLGITVINCYENIDTKSHEHFKSALFTLLARLGKEYSLQPQILPLLMDGLMNFESQLIRASAIQAVKEMYRHSKSNPPKNIVDVLIVHLRDTYVIVHKAAIEAFRWRGSWLSKEQANEALELMIGWLYTYKDKPYDLSGIAESIMDIARRFVDIKDIAIQHIAAVLPTNEESVDQKIVENMIRCVDPDEPTAVIVARQISWCLAKYDSERFNSYEFSERAKMFEWLHELPHVIYEYVKSNLFESAKQLAKKDAWEACYFASLFAKHEDYSLEEEILTLAASSLGHEHRYSKVKTELQLLGTMAAMNSYLQDGNLDHAYSLLSAIRESDT